jgi:hypothetical protein
MAIFGVLKNNKFLIAGGGTLFIIIAALPSIYYYRQYRAAQLQITNPTEAGKEQAATTLVAVGKLMVLPTGETPTIALVQDITKLSGQPFYAKAKNGDTVLIYTTAKEAIIYRPSVNKIVEVAPVNIANTASASAQSVVDTPTPTYSVVLRNGTTSIGATQKIANTIGTKTANLTVSDRDTAKLKTYTKTVIIDVNGDKSGIASEVASALGISVGSLPKGESLPNADFLIIVGTDQK